ncbi:glycosyltransferase family 4 protein, partial [Anaerorhabdus sp.]|uniref:glycosyltransferase family 4 protein n=1 Tax=Anaerorhabdus sp. TaxID=1872524 RepID=UPI002FC7F4B5
IKNNNLQNRVFLLGYRNDIERILAISDIFVFPSLREGLPTSIIEAMASGLPVIASRIRGNTDLIDEKVNGFTYPLGNSCEFIDKLNILLEDNELLLQLSSNNINKSTQYDKDLLAERLVEIYKI